MLLESMLYTLGSFALWLTLGRCALWLHNRFLNLLCPVQRYQPLGKRLLYSESIPHNLSKMLVLFLGPFLAAIEIPRMCIYRLRFGTARGTVEDPNFYGIV